MELTVGMTAEVEGNITVNDDAVNKMVAYIEKYHPDEATENKHEAAETKGDKTVELLYNPQETPKVEDAVIALTDKLASVNRKVTVKALPDDITKYTQTPNVDTFVIYFHVTATRLGRGDLNHCLKHDVPGMISRVCGRIEAHLVDCRKSGTA